MEHEKYIYRTWIGKWDIEHNWEVKKLVGLTKWRKLPLYRVIGSGQHILHSNCMMDIAECIDLDQELNR